MTSFADGCGFGMRRTPTPRPCPRVGRIVSCATLVTIFRAISRTPSSAPYFFGQVGVPQCAVEVVGAARTSAPRS